MLKLNIGHGFDLPTIKTNTTVVDDEKSAIHEVESSGAIITIIDAEKFGGEHNIGGSLYILSLWVVSAIAFVTNMTQAFLVKIFSRQNHSIDKILWKMGRSKSHFSSLFVDYLSRYNHMSKYHAATWKSLDVFYNYFTKIKPKLKKNLEGIVTRLWIEKMENRQAILNRKKIVTNLLVDSFFKYAAIHDNEIRIISVASGSAQVVLDAMSTCSMLNIQAIFVDIDQTALDEAKRVSEEMGIAEKVKTVRGAVNKFEEVCTNFNPHIIEMVGFLDYQRYDKAVKLICQSRKFLADGGIYITCNINYNREKIFLDWVLLWKMIYRNKHQFLELLIEGGFSPDNIQIVYEPFEIHGIGVCRK